MVADDSFLEASRQRSTNARKRERQAMTQRGLLALVLLMGGLGAPALLFSNGGLARLDELSLEKRRVDMEISRAEKRIEQLRAQVRAVREDPSAIERAARDDLGLVRQTEAVFLFSSPRSTR